MTTNAHIYAIKNIINKGIASDDSRFSNRLILHFLNVNRALLLKQKIDKYHEISDQSYQSLCIDLVQGFFHNCCDIKIPLDCTILKSTSPLPKLLVSRWGNFIKTMTLDGTIISESNITSNDYSQYSITNKILKDGWFIHDNYLYILNNTKLKKVLVNGLWDDPSAIAGLNCTNNNSDTPCVDENESEYPIDAELVTMLYDITIKQLLSSYQFPQDDATDARAVENVNAKEPNER